MLGRFARRWRPILGALTAIAAVSLAAAPAAASQEAVVKVSDDPFTNVTSPPDIQRTQHRTEVEPDTFGFGSTMVTAFQTARVFNGGSADIGFATTHDGGNSFTHGFLPSATVNSTPANPTYVAVSDPSVAFDFRDHVWMISFLGLRGFGEGAVDVLASRSTDDGATFGAPVVVAATNTFFDKNWSVCDNTPASPHFGNCYTEFDNANLADLEQMSTSSDSGLTWGPNLTTADQLPFGLVGAHGLGGQPVVQPDGTVVVPFEGIRIRVNGVIVGSNDIRSFTSHNGGASWDASVEISFRTTHANSGGLRTSALPSAEINRDGEVFVVWQDRRFEPGGTANDIVMSTSADGTTWSGVSRLPIDSVGSNVDHFIPGLGVDSTSAGDHTLLALTYYFYPVSTCTPGTCQLEVGFTSSLDGGQSWSQPEVLAGPMKLNWLADTTQGRMVGDYISTSFLAGQQRVLDAFAIGFAPAPDGTFNEPMFSGIEKVRSGDHSTNPDPVVFVPDPDDSTVDVPTAF